MGCQSFSHPMHLSFQFSVPDLKSVPVNHQPVLKYSTEIPQYRHERRKTAANVLTTFTATIRAALHSQETLFAYRCQASVCDSNGEVGESY